MLMFVLNSTHSLIYFSYHSTDHVLQYETRSIFCNNNALITVITLISIWITQSLIHFTV